MKNEFLRYVTRNMAGMVGLSAYLLADTFFIARAAGADGIAVLNLVLPLYGLIYAIGSMIGIGSVTRYALEKGMGKSDVNGYFAHSLFWQLLCSIPFVLAGIFAPVLWLKCMGADAALTGLGRGYTQIVQLGAPFFMINYTFTSFTRNDGAPTVAMAAELAASGMNIVLDYLLMFPAGMGLSGAALATAIAPVISCLVCSIHLISGRGSLRVRWRTPSLSVFADCCRLGTSAFVGEMSSAVTTAIFNTLLLMSVGNIGVAAYGVVANYSLVGMALFNGLAQGMQPLVSRAFGEGRREAVDRLLRWGIYFAAAMELLIVALTWYAAPSMSALFNSEHNAQLAEYADRALRLFVLGYLFAGINIVLSAWFSAAGAAWQASLLSTLRGIAAIGICAVVMAAIMGMDGIWLSFPAAELITLAAGILLLKYVPVKMQKIEKK